jgi:hypothetical protein
MFIGGLREKGINNRPFHGPCLAAKLPECFATFNEVLLWPGRFEVFPKQVMSAFGKLLATRKPSRRFPH